MPPRHIAVIVSMESFARDGARPQPEACDLTSGADLADVIAALGHRVDLVYADRDLGAQLDAQPYDGCLIALHGRLGGSGAVQRILAERRIPWIGPSAPATSLAFDKAAARQILAYQNLPVPSWVELSPEQPLDHAKLALLGWPCVLKPRRGAHAAGLTRLAGADAVRNAVEAALCLDEHLLLERNYEGIEVQVALLDGVPLGTAHVHRQTALSEPDEGPIAGYVTCPPNLTRGRLDGLERMAARAARVLGLCRGVSRVDFLVDPRGNEVLLEVEPLPSLHRDGSVARIARAGGLPHRELIRELVERFEVRAPRSTSTTATHAARH